MRIQASIEFMLILSAVAAMCLGVITLYSKNVFSQSSALASIANNSSSNADFSLPSLGSSYTAPQNVIYLNSYSVALVNRSERLAYNMSVPVAITNLSVFDHCTYIGYFGSQPFDVKGECGTTNAWDYQGEGISYCLTSTTFCILQSDTGYSVESTLAQRSYLYNFTLMITSPDGVMRSSITSSGGESQVMLANSSVGYAKVVGVTSAEPFQSVSLRSNATASTPLNQSAYEQYTQVKNLLYPMLSYYNSTGVDPVTQAAIQQTIDSFNTSLRSVTRSGPAELRCTVADGRYVCNANYPFFYAINVTLTGVGAINQTLYYLGSTVSIRSG
jgi:hypothetical protein